MFLLSFIVLYSCATRNIVDERYPETWADIRIENNGTCASISGSFGNLGEVANKNVEFVPTLDGSIFSRPLLAKNRGRVDIKHEVSGSTIAINLIGEILHQDKYRSSFEEKVTCANGWVSLNEEISSYSEGLFVKGESNSLFVKDVKGNLVIRKQYTTTSKSLLGFREKVNIDIWFRFFKVK